MTAMIESIRLPSVAVRWALQAPPGPALDVLVAGLVGAGVHVEPIVAGSAYRLAGQDEMLAVLAQQLTGEGVKDVSLGHEAAPTGEVNMASSVEPKHPPRRSVTVHGGGIHAARFIRQAIDMGLSVATVGAQRWRVGGRTAALVQWLSDAWVKDVNDVMGVLGLTAETIADEDTPAPPVPTVVVQLPDRRVESVIDRDAAGNIVNVTQRETTVQ